MIHLGLRMKSSEQVSRANLYSLKVGINFNLIFLSSGKLKIPCEMLRVVIDIFLIFIIYLIVFQNRTSIVEESFDNVGMAKLR